MPDFSVLFTFFGIGRSRNIVGWHNQVPIPLLLIRGGGGVERLRVKKGFARGGRICH